MVWPHPGKVGLREHNALSGRTDIHVFDQWCHLATVHDDTELDAALTSTAPALAFDLDTYRLLIKHLSGPGSKGPNLIRFAASPLQRARAEI